MRFTIKTDDGRTFAIFDKREQIVTNISDDAISQFIVDRIAGDAWRKAIARITSVWQGKFKYVTELCSDPWKRKLNCLAVSFNERAKPVVRYYSKHGIREKRYLVTSANATNRRSWTTVWKSLADSWSAKKNRHDNPWKRWALNAASSQRKRIRRKAERSDER